MNHDLMQRKFAEALTYQQYVATGTEAQQQRWRGFYDAVSLSAEQQNLVGGFVRSMKALVISGIWCGDCVQQCPLLARIAEANPARVDVRFLDRDQHRELSDLLQINDGQRVPVALFLAEDFHWCATFGDRTLHRYRALARHHLGPSCPTGIGPADSEEVRHTLADWLGEFERVQLMLRLSGRLRKLHCD